MPAKMILALLLVLSPSVTEHHKSACGRGIPRLFCFTERHLSLLSIT